MPPPPLAVNDIIVARRPWFCLAGWLRAVCVWLASCSGLACRYPARLALALTRAVGSGLLRPVLTSHSFFAPTEEEVGVVQGGEVRCKPCLVFGILYRMIN